MKQELQDPSWKLLGNDEEVKVWEEFDHLYHFNPHYHESPTGIREPRDSVTFNISNYYTYCDMTSHHLMFY